MAMPIDVRQVDWLYVAILALFALVTNLLANLLSFRRRGVAAVLAAVLFAAAFVFWTYYPHGLPLPTTLSASDSELAFLPDGTSRSDYSTLRQWWGQTIRRCTRAVCAFDLLSTRSNP
jgi:hypothetical protein